METLGTLLVHSVAGSTQGQSNVSPGRSGGSSTVDTGNTHKITEVKHRNVLFLLDESGSVGVENFKHEKNLTMAFIHGIYTFSTCDNKSHIQCIYSI